MNRKSFLGSRYNVQCDGLLLHGDGAHLNDLFFHSDAQVAENVSAISGTAISDGYAYAFTDPPYKLRGTHSEKADLFARINHEILSGISNGTVIYEWPTDWSTYFEAGHEWWGSFCWTLCNSGSDQVSVIAASTTD